MPSPMPPHTSPSSTRPSTGSSTRSSGGPGGEPTDRSEPVGVVHLIGEGTTLLTDVEALHGIGHALAALQLPIAVEIPPSAAAGDGLVGAVISEFCNYYNGLVDNTAADHVAATRHLHATAADYAAAETAATLGLDPTTPTRAV
jgi:hypothetical protein